MHLSIALATGLFGLSPLALAPNPSAPASPPNAAGWTLQPTISATTDVKVLEGAQRWYNELWNELVSIDGDWDEVAGAAGVVLRPKGTECTLAVYSQVSDELHYLPVPEDGQVTFVDGWIRIDQVGAWRRSGSGGAAMSMTKGPQGCAASYTNDEVSSVTFSGGCWEEQEPSGDGCGEVQICGVDGAQGCKVTFGLTSMMRGTGTEFESECGGDLVFKRCTDDGQSSYCVEQG